MIELTVLLKKYLLQYNSLNITDNENTWKINKMISTLQQANLLIIYLHNYGFFFYLFISNLKWIKLCLLIRSCLNGFTEQKRH